MADRIPALTLRRPWPSLILHAGKNVENRTWSTNYRGPLYLHAGKSWDDGAFDWAFIPTAARSVRLATGGPADYAVGVVGMVQLVDVVRNHPSPWAVPDQWHWLLESPRTFARPVPSLGHQGLWWPTGHLADQLIEEALRG